MKTHASIFVAIQKFEVQPTNQDKFLLLPSKSKGATVDTDRYSNLAESSRTIAHRLWAEHPCWKGAILLYDDGTMSRPQGDSGTYVLEPFETLVLDWDRWKAEHLTWSKELHFFRSDDHRFVIHICTPLSVDDYPSVPIAGSTSQPPFSRTNVIWSRSLGIAYYPIAKNACSSVKMALLSSAGVQISNRHELHSICPTLRSMRLEIGSLKFAPFEETLENKALVTFAVVRHPLDRLLSCYANKVVQGDGGLQPRFKAARNFEEFVYLVSGDANANEHFKPQVASLPSKLDVVLRFDCLKEDWDRMRLRFQLPLGNLPHQNPSGHEPWKDVYTPQLRKLAEKLYADDLRIYSELTAG